MKELRTGDDYKCRLKLSQSEYAYSHALKSPSYATRRRERVRSKTLYSFSTETAIMRLLFYSLLATLSSAVWALHESDVGVMDWHKHLVGVPLLQSPATAPVFHRVGSKSIILSATMSNVLAALDSDNGTVGMYQN